MNEFVYNPVHNNPSWGVGDKVEDESTATEEAEEVGEVTPDDFMKVVQEVCEARLQQYLAPRPQTKGTRLHPKVCSTLSSPPISSLCNLSALLSPAADYIRKAW